MTANKFSLNGFHVIKGGISKPLLRSVQNDVIHVLNNKSKVNYTSFQKILLKSQKNSKFEFIKKINEYLIYKKVIDKILKEKKIHNYISSILGLDLSYENNPNTLILNIPEKPSSKKNYMFKDWHQEVWSGAGTNTLQVWIPIFQKDNSGGQIELVKDSHKWGHVPHRNRRPIEMPKSFKTIKTNIKLGDVLIFSTTIMHRSLPTKFSRLTLPTLVRNFKYKNYSFENNKSWTVYSNSEVTKIERYLGNHYLSPFRTADIKVKFE